MKPAPPVTNELRTDACIAPTIVSRRPIDRKNFLDRFGKDSAGGALSASRSRHIEYTTPPANNPTITSSVAQ